MRVLLFQCQFNLLFYSYMKKKLISLPLILKGTAVPIQDQLLIKYLDTQYSKEGTEEIIFCDHRISYTIEEYDMEGQILNTDYLNQRKAYLPLDQNISYGLHYALKSMKLHETAVFRVNYAFRVPMNQYGNKSTVVRVFESEAEKEKAEADYFWVIQIRDVQDVLDPSDISMEKRKEVVQKRLDLGRQRYREGQFEQAITEFQKARTFAKDIPKKHKEVMSDATILEFQQAASKTYSNEALCRVPKREWHKIKDLCDKAIKFDDKNFKAYYWLGRSFYERGFVEEAKAKFVEILQLFPDADLKEVQKQIESCDEDAISKKKEMQMCKRIISNLDKEDPDEKQRQMNELRDELKRRHQQEELIKLTQEGKIIENDLFSKMQ